MGRNRKGEGDDKPREPRLPYDIVALITWDVS